MLSRRCMRFWPLLLLSGLPVATAGAQGGTPYTLDQVLGLVGNVASERILQIVRGPCIDFRLSSGNLERLRAAGADKDLLAGLRSTCNKSDSKEGGDASDTKRRDVRRDPTPTPTPSRRKTVVIPPRPAPYTPPPVYTPPVTKASNTSAIDWDFRSSQPLTAGHFNNCQYDYSPAGYTIRVLEYGGSCLDGSMQEWEPSVRVTTQAVPVSGNAGYTYGLRFGISDDTTVGYYALEVSSYGHFELSRYRNKKWEVVFPWQTGTGINASAANTITADIRGSTATFIINGITQYTYQAPAPIRGRVGFGIIGFDKAGPYPAVTFSAFNVSGQKGTGPSPTTTTGPVTNNTVTSVDYDFTSTQPLTSGRYGKCQYDYSSSGYTVSVAEFGTTCIDGPLGDRPANVRISTTAVGLRGNTGYTYGLRFGYTSDSTVGYYAYEISEGGSFQLSRYRMNRWEPLIPWTSNSAVHPASSRTPNNMSVEVRGTSLTLFANGTQVGTYQTPYPAVGPAGFGVIGYEQSGEKPAVTFSRFSITPLSGSNTTTVTPTPTTPTVNWDFTSSQPLSAGLFGKCRYDYVNGGYTISIDTPGSTCLDGPSGDQPASVRISATALGVRGGTGYTYGFRFGYTTDQSIGYYAFELSEGGSFQLSRKHNDAWDAVVGWQRVSTVNPASSGIPNQFAVEIRGTSIVMFVNGTQVGSYQGPYPPVGPASFGIIGYDQSLANPAVVFTRFSTTPLY